MHSYFVLAEITFHLDTYFISSRSSLYSAVLLPEQSTRLNVPGSQQRVVKQRLQYNLVRTHRHSLFDAHRFPQQQENMSQGVVEVHNRDLCWELLGDRPLEADFVSPRGDTTTMATDTSNSMQVCQWLPSQSSASQTIHAVDWLTRKARRAVMVSHPHCMV